MSLFTICKQRKSLSIPMIVPISGDLVCTVGASGVIDSWGHFSSLFALGLALFFITFVVLALAKWMLIRMEKNQGVKT